MIELKGKHNTAKVFTDSIESSAQSQIIELCNQESFKDSKIRIMPDVHAGMGCVIGFTSTLTDKVIPNIVGVDIGCGMLTVKLGKIDIDYKKLDSIINNNIPSGFNTHDEPVKHFRILELRCYDVIRNKERVLCSVGTLGGGNHFIEIDEDEYRNKYLVIHSGSRNVGKQVADIYQKKAIDICINFAVKQIIKEYKSNNKECEISEAIKIHKNQHPNIPKALCYLEGSHMMDYMHDMSICQDYASVNRETMATIILKHLLDTNLSFYKYFHTTHNYINFNDKIIRKGAISANYGEQVLIPINMKDGSILAEGKGNEDWNRSAPHGAGRTMSRRHAKDILSMDEYEESMKDIYSTSVVESTLDEAPKAYKDMSDILLYTSDTINKVMILKPKYNYKAH